MKKVIVPDLGNSDKVDVIEVLVSVGDTVSLDAPLITLEGDKATMEVPAPFEGVVKELSVKVGDKVSSGHFILSMMTNDMTEIAEPITNQQDESTLPEEKAVKQPLVDQPLEVSSQALAEEPGSAVMAGPGVRRLSRQLGIALEQLNGSGKKGRITRADLEAFIKARMNSPQTTIPQQADIDFSEFGEVETITLNKVKRLTGEATHRSWVSIPHVTQFDEADITELEAFRQNNKHSAELKGAKLTPLVFIMKAVVTALKAFPMFNASLKQNQQALVLKKYFHIGVAVETPNGLLVPVIRDVDKKGLIDLAIELSQISAKARDKGLSIKEMQGSCFTISSLGGIGGTAFTPIINGSDVGILGVSKSKLQPVYDGHELIPRLLLPLSLSYDHRVIDGAEAARFTQYLVEVLSDIRKILM